MSKSFRVFYGLLSVGLSPTARVLRVANPERAIPDNFWTGTYNTYLQSPKGQRDFIAYYATEVMVQRDLNKEELFWIIEQSLNTPYYIASNLFASGMFSNYIAEAKRPAKRAKLCRSFSFNVPPNKQSAGELLSAHFLKLVAPYGVSFALKVVSPTRNRFIWGVSAFFIYLLSALSIPRLRIRNVFLTNSLTDCPLPWLNSCVHIMKPR